MGLDLYRFLIAEEFLLKLVVSAALGAVLGFERERSHKPAGLRTHILVSMGASLYVAMSLLMAEEFAQGADRISDPNRVLAQVVVGVSFLCAGTIFHTRGSTQGLTTAASIWVTAAIGAAVGGGFYAVAAATTLLAFVVLSLLNILSPKMFRRRDLRIVTIEGARPLPIEEIEKILGRFSNFVELEEAHRTPERDHFAYRLQIDERELALLLAELGKISALQVIKAS